MNTTDPSDLAPLSIGPGLALGLFLLLGLPTERRSPTPAASPLTAPPPRNVTLHAVGRECSASLSAPRRLHTARVP